MLPVGAAPLLIVAAVLLPLAGSVASFIAPRRARVIGALVAAALAADVLALAAAIMDTGGSRVAIGGWGAPLGIALAADGLAVFLLLTTAAAGLAALLYASRYFKDERDNPAGFYPLAWLLLAGLNALFVSADVFNLYVTLEVIGLAAVGLVAKAGGAAALTAAMRYLLVTFLASLTYLLGVALLYHLTGVLDIAALGGALRGGPVAWTALGLMTGALLLKSALFPLHFWLPPAHSSAPAPVSALLSALVVKASLYLLLRLWLEVMPNDKGALGEVIGAFGAIAVLWGSVQALRQDQLKMMVAYSTVAQLGYMFMPFALDGAAAAAAWRGAIYLVLSHALAKTALFLAVGNIQTFGGDSISQLDNVVQRLPITMAAFGIAGVSIAGLPPSGGFIAKWLILEALIGEQRWWLAAVVVLGGLLASIYIFRVVGPAFTGGAHARPPRRVPGLMEWIAFALALATLVLGFTAPPLLALLDAGAPLGSLEQVE